MIAAQVPALPGFSLLLFLLQIGVLLLLALVMGRLAVRLGMPAVVGELCSGILLGPSILAQALPSVSAWLFPADPQQSAVLDGVGQLAVLLLVAVAGGHLDLGMVRRQGATAAKVSLLGLVIPLGLGVAVGFLLPLSLLSPAREQVVFALFLGVAMCVSAIPVIAKTLMDMKLIHRDFGQLTLTAGVLDDAFGWLMLSVISAMATTGVRAGTVLTSAATLLAVVLFAFTLGRPLVKGCFRLAARSGEAGPTVATTVVLVVLAAAGTQALGLEAVFGAFLCGVLISEYGRPDPARLAPLRLLVMSMLAPIFFATAGLRIDLTELARPPVLLAALLILAVAVAGKFAGAYLGARFSGLSSWEGLALGAGLNARGVIEILIAMIGLRLGVLNTAAYTIIVLVAVVTSLMAPPILRLAARRIEHTEAERVRLARQFASSV
uniref:Putative antiporter n=1 Tax=Actinomadura melliaura TaxID=360723 RepID=Q0H2W7_9ACTN|nr:putative antiporter [Actinomadura melliaura]